MLDLHQLIAKAYDLDPIPMSGTKLANLVADPESSLESIAQIVSLDQALTARTLRAANSAASAARSQITTVKDAVVRLGRSTILTLGFGAKVRQQLQQPLPEFGLAENVLWRHSVAAALAVESMGVLGKVPIPPESYAAALLHDIGKGVEADGDGSHIEVGVDLARRLGEDPKVLNAIGAHHGDVEPESVEAVIVMIADAISAARPGARKETLDNYLKRLENLESIAEDFDGVDKAYAIQAGRELRILVNNEKITDDAARELAKNVAKRIESELKYPGRIKVTIIREMRVIEYAR